MHIAIVEDTENDRAKLKHMITTYFEERDITSVCDSYTSGESFLGAFYRGRYDIIFLDIYMPGIDGMETARKIRESDGDCPLVFFSTSYAHAVESYEVRASYYLTKPLREEMLNNALNIICSLPEKDHSYLTVSLRGGIKRQIPLKDILYADCVARHSYIHLKDKQMTADNSIASILDILSKDARFLSCNRNIMINMDWVESVSPNEFHLKNGDSVPIRQRGRGAVKKTFLEYSLRDLRKESAT